VRLIDAEGKQVGIVETNTALAQAEEAGLDLVEISPNVLPTVCRIMDYGKYLFEQSKRKKKKAKQLHTKELKLRPVTEMADYMVRIRRAIDFLRSGNKVKFIVRFRGREMAYQNLGHDVLRRLENDLKDYGVVEQQPKLEGRQLVMLVVPHKHK